MTYGRELQAVARAIQEAERCPLYAPTEVECCDGLDGCEECLELAAEAALSAVERSR